MSRRGKTTKRELEFVTIARVVLSKPSAYVAKNVPEICELAEKAAAPLKQHSLTNQDPKVL
jgi:hypothetical protein